MIILELVTDFYKGKVVFISQSNIASGIGNLAIG